MSSTSHVPFPSTDWRTISSAGHGGAARKVALDQLLSRYLPALRSYLKFKWRISGHRADDLLQSFVAEKVLEQDLVARADRERGKFRHLLITSLNRYIISDFRRSVAARRAEGEQASLDQMDDVSHPADSVAPDVFDVAWARQALDLALQRMREDCDACGRRMVGSLFEARVVAPALEGAAVPSYGELLEQFKFESPEQASNLLVTAKRMFLRVLRAVVSEYADDPDEVEEELRLLKQVLARDE
jgi:hypothetical protein